MSANDIQVGGTHYRSAFQHWDIVVKWHVPYLDSQVMRYVTRCHKKNKRQDMEKALHFAEKMFEVRTSGWKDKVLGFWRRRSWFYPSSLATVYRVEAAQDLNRYADANGLDQKQRLICWLCLTGCEPKRLVSYVRAYMQEQYPQDGDPLHRVNWSIPEEPMGRGYVDQGD